jgi:hypothetical protein
MEELNLGGVEQQWGDRGTARRVILHHCLPKYRNKKRKMTISDRTSRFTPKALTTQIELGSDEWASP